MSCIALFPTDRTKYNCQEIGQETSKAQNS